MSYLATLLPLSIPVAPDGMRRATRRRACRSQGRPDSGALRLFDAMKLLVRDIGDGLHARACELIEPYQACRWCAARARWCAEGTAAVAATAATAATAAITAMPPAPGPPGVPRLHPGLPGLHGLHGLQETLRIGRRADPYPAAEASAGATRRLLESLADLREGLEVSIFTRSPLLLRDLDLLADLDQKHGISVGVVIPAADPQVVRRVEAHLTAPPSAAERFELVHALAARGIATRVLCTPLVPGVNNSVPGLRRLLALADRAGASDVISAPRHPALPPTPFEAEHLLPIFQRLRLEQGFPRAAVGRG